MPVLILRRAAAASPRTYSTTFTGTENPLSEGGEWIGGATVGLDWTDPRKSGGDAFGTQTTHSTPPFDDSIACLSGFAANHSCQATLHTVSITGSQEVELYVRMRISAHHASGYEIDILNQGTVNLVRWNGPTGEAGVAFDVILQDVSTNVSVADGAVWYAEIVDDVITVKCNGNTVLTHDTATEGASQLASGGNPGIGFWRVDGAATASNFAWADFSASDV